MSEEKKEGLYCSFCEKHQDEIAALIAGVQANICDECVAVCLGVLMRRISRHSATEQSPKRPSSDPAEAEE